MDATLRPPPFAIAYIPATVKGQPGVRVVDRDGRLVSVGALVLHDGRVTAMHSVVNPDRLAHPGPASDVALRPAR